MKFRVFFLKKKHIYLSMLIILIVFLAICFKASKDNKETFISYKSDHQSYKADLNGDGDSDSLNIKKDKDKYDVLIDSNKKSYKLEPDKPFNTIGSVSTYWLPRITLLDISRDRIPEIFIQASDKDKALQHIFIWNGEKFECVFSNNNNILGFIDHKNNKTPKIISGKVTENNILLSNFIFLNYKFKSYNFQSEPTFMGKDTVVELIKYIVSLPGGEAAKPNEIFYPGLMGNSSTALSTMVSDNSTYVFLDGLFMDNKCNKDGEVTEVKWTLSFKGTSNSNNQNIKNYTLNMILKPHEESKEKFYYKISSIILSNEK